MQSISSKTAWAMKLNTQKGDFMKIFFFFRIVNTNFLLHVQTFLQSILVSCLNISDCLITKDFYLWNTVQHIIILIMFQHWVVWFNFCPETILLNRYILIPIVLCMLGKKKHIYIYIYHLPITGNRNVKQF